jgi:hypothetical protein
VRVYDYKFEFYFCSLETLEITIYLRGTRGRLALPPMKDSCIEYVYSDLHALYTQLKSAGIASVISAGGRAGMPILLPILVASQALQMPV